MSVHLLWVTSLILALLGLILPVLQAGVARIRESRALNRRVRLRLTRQETDTQELDVIAHGAVEQMLIRAGLNASLLRVILVITGGLAAIVALVLLRGWIEAAVALVSLVLIVATLWRIRHEQLRRRIFEALPAIVDSVLRSLSAGRSVEQSLISAFAEAPPVFDLLNLRLRNAVQQGRDYSRVLDEFGALYDIPVMAQIAIALRTSAHFGSSVRPMLREVSKAIRSRQELRREFMAATSETRFTAVVFALLPPGLAIYIVLINENFARVLLDTDAGHTMVLIAVVLQVLGSLFIWRLIRGVGRG